MGRRRELVGVAGGLAGAFVGRNDDLRGYWAPPMLARIARRLGIDSLAIDLVEPSRSRPRPGRVVGALAECYRDRTWRLVESIGLDRVCVAGATILVEFLPAGDPPTPRGLRGAPFRCTVRIVDDLGRARTACALGFCEPHDPRRETRSARYERTTG